MNKMNKQSFNDDSGSVLVAAIILMIVLAMIVSVLVVFTTGSASVTELTDGAVKAQMNRDSGEATAVAHLNETGSECPIENEVYESSSADEANNVFFEYTVKWGPNENDDCTNASTVTITSTGFDRDPSVSNSESIVDSSRVSVYEYNPALALPVAGEAIVTSIFSTTENSINVTGLSLINPNNFVGGGDMIFDAEGFDCNSNSFIEGSVIIVGGDVDLTQCEITGDLIVHGGTVEIKGGVVVGGSVISNYQHSGVSTFWNVEIGGDVHFDSPVALTGNTSVDGNVYMKESNVTIDPGVVISGSLNLNDDAVIDTWSGGPTVNGGIVRVTGGVQSPDLNDYVDFDDILDRNTWIDYDFVEQNWVDSGWSIVNATSSQCDYQNDSSLVTTLENYTSPTVINLQECSEVNFYAMKPKLKTDVGFIIPVSSSEVNMQQMDISSADNNIHSFNIVVPDKVNDETPTCSSGNNGINFYGTEIRENVTGFAYTPCGMIFGGSTGTVWRGQIYFGGDSTISGSNANLEYYQVDLPGLYMKTGGTGEANDAGSIGLHEIGGTGQRISTMKG